MPRHVAVRHQLPVDVAPDLAVPPAAVDVNDADHVPLGEGRDAGGKIVSKGLSATSRDTGTNNLS